MEWRILLNKLNNNLSEKEKIQLEKWLQEDSSHKDYLNKMENEWANDFEYTTNISKIISEFKQFKSTKQYIIRRNRSMLIYKYAASIILFIGISLGIIVVSNNSNKRENIKYTKVQNTIQSGSSKALLYLSDGKEINLGDINNKKIKYKDGNIIINEKTLTFEKPISNINNDKNLSLQEFDKIIIPRGGEYKLILSDGTKVWFNSESELRFPQKFSESERRVYMKGEIYFEVTKNKKAPFYVETEHGTVKVYGTKFNITDYSDENLTKVTLAEGSVSFISKFLPEMKIIPGEQISYNKGKKTVVVNKVKLNNILAWKNDKFIFENESLENIMKKLSRWYNLDVIFINEDMKKLSFSGTLDKFDNVESFLKYFEVDTDVRFVIEGSKIIIMRK